MTLAWNFFSKTGAKSVDICPIALQHAYLRFGDKLLAIAKFVQLVKYILKLNITHKYPHISHLTLGWGSLM